MTPRPASACEAHVAFYPGEKRGELRRMAGEFYGVVASFGARGLDRVAVVLFADAGHCQEFRAARAAATLSVASR